MHSVYNIRVYQQVIITIIIFQCMVIFFLWNYSLLNIFDSSYVVAPILLCNAKQEAPVNSSSSSLSSSSSSIKILLTTIIGALVGQLVVLIFQCMQSLTKTYYNRRYSIEHGNENHPISMSFMMIIITIIQLIVAIVTYSDFFQYYCIDFLLVESFPYTWIEWLCTVPSMFFLVTIIDSDLSEWKMSDIWIEFLGGGSLFFLFLVNFPFPFMINMIWFVIANVMMVVALYWQYHISNMMYKVAYQEYIKIPLHKRHDLAHKLSINELKRISNRMNATIYMAILFAIIPIAYYFRAMRLIDTDTYLITILILNLLSKTLFIQALSTIHIKYYDPVKVKLIKDMKLAEENRLTFLRYVFHEVRVPLNSVALGLQVLLETTSLAVTHKDIIDTIRDGKKGSTAILYYAMIHFTILYYAILYCAIL